MAIPYLKTVPQQQPLNLVKFALYKPSDALDSLSFGSPFKVKRTVSIQGVIFE
ncbi:hypothetical protein F5I97DRAFT_1923056 [Phlebopus sp. FC_14]|nr:hypothetical protein F5I97DRAFT_1923056 [Phlebopus sp. FC_14]